MRQPLTVGTISMIDRAPLVEDIQNYAQNIVDTVREPLLILDTTLRVQSGNRAFYHTFKVSPEETENRSPLSLLRCLLFKRPNADRSCRTTEVSDGDEPPLTPHLTLG